jgi:protein-disulfide isomerase
MSKGFWGVIIAIVLVFVGVVALTSGGKTNAPGNSSAKGSLSQHVQGKGTSDVTLVEYGDYQCPFCEQYYSTVKAAQAEFGDKIKFQFRNFPLTSLHPNAFAAARAAEAASLQNKFWEMHDALYEPSNYQVWTGATNPNPYFNQFAQQIGLNVDRFKTDFASSKVNDTINADMAEGNRLGITGTPSFFVNGKKTQIPNDLKSFEKTINEAISAKASASANQ